ncbi:MULTISPECIES: NO-inducible flavohemoprotein [Acetobacteraceae]|uniref:nitric oxide dioxygenase n=5 Tax=Acetobacteraceae TaxID=433 RepID=A0ABQ5WEU8_GLUJA|nr:MULTISPECIES: NO-inducible flavohemoprotein [Acetobacteraceae]KXV02413.1 dihydropteridine reductase [Acetobacter cerevisiae]KXV29485.1 dihydropteridine reductase [Gluconobacter japonicus]KXV29588.1 dihydropteridine reductase [Gluconobacter japonicus]MCP1271868.1 NO-inducible flavohemoprotein [Acetobacter cerevisiae]MCP1279822.1 NO-inducible flavohemoprotein [Acetobacter cerevisiae]
MSAPLDDKTRAIISATVPALKAHGTAITTEMYKRLLSTPAIRDLFNLSHQQDGEQPKALALAVLCYAEHINDLGALGGMVERIAEKHVGLNILPEHYPYVAEALLGAIGHVLGDAATPEIAEAWGKAYWFLADILIGREKQIYDEHKDAPGGWAGWRAFRVRSRRAETPTITSFELVPVDGGALFRHKAGQYLSFKLDVPGHGSQRRNYSISSEPGADHYRISVRQQDGGVVSTWLHETVKEGDMLQVANPAGDFFLDETSESPVVFLTAGVGLTPVMSMLGELAQTSVKRKIHYVHGADTEALAAFRPEIEDLASRGILAADFFYAKESVPAVSHGVAAHAGRVTTAWVKQNLDRSATYYICGPDSFMRDMVDALRTENLPAKQIRYEFFGSAADPDLVLSAA